MGLSRPRVRETLSALVSVGLLETRQGSGTFVADFSPSTLSAPFGAVVGTSVESLSQLLEVRRVLETAAVRWACERHDAELLTEFGRRVGELRSRLDDVSGFASVEAGIHALIHEATGNQVLIALMESLAAMVHESRQVTSVDPGLRELTVYQHERLLDAFRRRDVEGAVSAMREHLEHLGPAIDQRAKGGSDDQTKQPKGRQK